MDRRFRRERGKEDAEAKEHALVFEGDKFSVKKGDKIVVRGTFKIDQLIPRFISPYEEGCPRIVPVEAGEPFLGQVRSDGLADHAWAFAGRVEKAPTGK